jgi:ABC-type multidrug transport system fused ATPase/permease subunit
LDVPNQWPENPPAFRQVLQQFFQASQECALNILEALAIALQLPNSYFTDLHSQQNHAGVFNYYPNISQAPKLGQTRFFEHTDLGSITLLFQDQGGGLEVYTPQGEWITTSFSATFLEKVLEMTAFLVIVSSISQQIAIVMLVYTVIGNLIAIYLTQELNKINQEELELKAEYNYSLTHLRNHAESIAFFQGEKQESNIIQRRFSNVLKNIERKINWERGKEIFNRGYQAIIQIFPFLVLGPLYINGEIDFGQVGQASLATGLFANAMAD